jgi:nitrous oxidase accessory protein NosD
VTITDVKEPGTVISGNYGHHCIRGLSVGGSTGVTLTDNKLEAVGEGLPADGCTDLVIKHNQFFQLAYTGLTLSNCTNCDVEGNSFTSGVTEALRLTAGASGNTIKANTISEIRAEFSGAGLVLKGAKSNTITNNTFTHCAVALAWDGKDNANNVVKDNTLTDNAQTAVTQNGAAEVEKTNQVDVTPEPRK